MRHVSARRSICARAKTNVRHAPVVVRRFAALLGCANIPDVTAIGHIIRIDPSRVDPPVLVVVSHAAIREPDHVLKCARTTCAPQALDTNILVVPCIVALV